MKRLVSLLLWLVGILIGLLAISYLLPGSYRVARSIEIYAPAGEVHSRVADLRQWADWTVWGDYDPEMIYAFSENTIGVGAWQKWSGPKSGRGELTITLSEPPRRVEYDLSFPDYGMVSKGAIVIEQGAGLVRVTWSDEGELGLNPINRWFGLFLDRMIGKDFAGGLERLKEISEKSGA